MARIIAYLLLFSPAAALASAPTVRGGGACTSALSCNLNGLCSPPSTATTAGSTCSCDSPWAGPTCGQLGYNATTPAAGKSLYNLTDPRNTWNGPIVAGPDGTFHLYDPIYKVGSLGGPTSVLHGTADVVTGPWDWTSRPGISTEGGENPAFVVFQDPEQHNKTVYSLWLAGKVRTAASPDGPFVEAVEGGWRYPGGNPAPLYHEGAFYLTNQKTAEVWTAPRVGGNWTVFAEIERGAGYPAAAKQCVFGKRRRERERERET